MILTKALTKTYKTGTLETKVLRGVDMHIEKGEFVAIMGRSGAGKSTLLYQLSLLDHPTSGLVRVDGVDTSTLTGSQRSEFRLNRLGYVFQDYALLPELTALENVILPLLQQGVSLMESEMKGKSALDAVGLGQRLKNLPSQLSGGEQQRVSIARAIAHQPKILFADEPTANLDSETGKAVMEIFKALHARGQTIVMVTHEEEYGRVAERIIRMHDGNITV
jgi:putative ABC transport system ATP-binding protein